MSTHKADNFEENLRRSKAARAGLRFPVGRIHRLLKEKKFADRVRGGAPAYLAAVMEYMAHRILELAGNEAREDMKTRIVPRHLLVAINNDEELVRVLWIVLGDSGVA